MSGDGDRLTATWYFNLHWQNDQDLYLAVLAYGRELLARVPAMTTLTLGYNVRDAVDRWSQGTTAFIATVPNSALAPPARLGWGEAPEVAATVQRIRPSVLALLAQEVGSFRDVDPMDVGKAVLESLDIEDPR